MKTRKFILLLALLPLLLASVTTFIGHVNADAFDLTTNPCGWMQSQEAASENLLGAPTPIFQGRIDTATNHVIMDITFAKGHNITNRASLESVYDPCSNTSTSTSTSWTVSAETDCTITLTLSRTLQEHVNDPNVQRVYSGGDYFQLTANMYAFYMFPSESADPTCRFVRFTSQYVIQAFLIGDSYANFESSTVSVATVRQDRIYVQSTGELGLQATITMLKPGAKLSNWDFVGSTPDGTISFAVQNVQETCSNVCRYALTTQTVGAHTDYTGVYTFGAMYSNPSENQASIPVQIVFSLQYSLPVPPTISTLNITTQITTYDTGFSAAKTQFQTTDDVWVLDAIVPSLTLSDRRLSINNAYLCCMKGRQAMPVYVPGDPSKPGCTANNPDIMANWAQLVNNGVPLAAQYAVQNRQLAFVNDKTGISFSAMALSSQTYPSQLCYLHVQAIFVPVVAPDQQDVETMSGKNKMLAAAALDNQRQLDVVGFSPFQIISVISGLTINSAQCSFSFGAGKLLFLVATVVMATMLL